MNYWLVKSEPSAYSWNQLLKDKKIAWDGVRNYQARNNLKAMKKGDQVLFYHSNEGLAIVGIAKVVKEFYQDPTTKEIQWVAVDLAPFQTFKTPISLTFIKAHPELKNMLLVKQSRISVVSVQSNEFDLLVELGMK